MSGEFTVTFVSDDVEYLDEFKKFMKKVITNEMYWVAKRPSRPAIDWYLGPVVETLSFKEEE